MTNLSLIGLAMDTKYFLCFFIVNGCMAGNSVSQRLKRTSDSRGCCQCKCVVFCEQCAVALAVSVSDGPNLRR